VVGLDVHDPDLHIGQQPPRRKDVKATQLRCDLAERLITAADNDRRRRRVVLTTRGRAKFAQARRAWKLAQDRFNSVFGESAAAKLRATLLRIARDERLATLTD
jgi:YD repeat-containing protein